MCWKLPNHLPGLCKGLNSWVLLSLSTHPLLGDRVTRVEADTLTCLCHPGLSCNNPNHQHRKTHFLGVPEKCKQQTQKMGT